MATAAPETIFVTRMEFNSALESLRRELSGAAKTHAECRGEISGKLDALLQSRIADAKAEGGIEAKVDRLIDAIVPGLKEEIEQIRETQVKQGQEIAEIRQAQSDSPSTNQAAGKDAPVTMRDIVRVLLAFGKLLLAAALGYWASNHHWRD
jgi:FtsZ-binding cell division protein ZapB